jgi:hypothetical protein
LFGGGVSGQRERDCNDREKKKAEAVHLCVIEEEGIFLRGSERKTVGVIGETPAKRLGLGGGERNLGNAQVLKRGKTFRVFLFRASAIGFRSTESARLARLFQRQIV